MIVLCNSCSPRKGCTADKNRTECKYYQPMTNEEWFNGLSTETKARIMHLVYIAGYKDGYNGDETIPLRDIKEWFKQPHTTRS